ncbi:alkane hydroxylase MAH1 [Beta vulgaris subsp. vulgaris]|uniref:alkane hydroxylase MAH1 n=1 Tax=Beta vulgaris subsp. vulgaris TaxID=3555 RepID=UPI0020371CC4|nr:alkane hydroxylase MAH1 [Beta vulgaris subsp. vulgaris]
MMVTIQYPEIFLAVVCFFLICYLTRHGIPWNWPFLGMLPSILIHLHRTHHRCVDILQGNNCSFLFKGPWFANMDFLMTVDPANIQHIMSSNFTNYPKGDEFLKIFDILGNGIFNSDGELWKLQRKITRALINHRSFIRFLVKITYNKVQKGLVPILQHAYKDGLVIDLQDVFQRLTFDTTCLLVSGHDPGCLSLEFPHVPFSQALDDAEEAIAFRHLLPHNFWELLKWLGLGQPKKLSQAWKVLDHFIDYIISMKREGLRGGKKSPFKLEQEQEEEGIDLLTSFLNEETRDVTSGINTKDDKFLRDTILNLMLAGRDTTSSALTWFTWLITQHPIVEEKIRNELKGIANEWHVFQIEETNKLTYLHAALCECLRLYPPVPFQHKSPIQPETLPSGHHVNPKTKVLFSLYAMGRMKGIWGEDCFEFKPERWITKEGKIKYEPPYKFLSFNAGPRTCLGKEVAFTQLKMVSATLIHNYKFHVVDGQHAEPDMSIVLHMKHGLKVKVSNRWSMAWNCNTLQQHLTN